MSSLICMYLHAIFLLVALPIFRRSRQCGDAAAQPFAQILGRISRIAAVDDRRHHIEHVADAVLQFRQQDRLALFIALALRDVLADLEEPTNRSIVIPPGDRLPIPKYDPAALCPVPETGRAA